MSILDDAIREHLELKRAHGADEGEVQRLEDEAFGPPRRPDEVDRFAEAPTEFLLSPGEEPAAAPEIADERERSGRRPDIADLQEAPPSGPPAELEAAEEASDDVPPPAAEVPPPPAGEAPADLPPPAAFEEEHPAGEHEIVADPGPDTEERRAIADQPTQMFDVEAEIGEPEAAAEPEAAEEPGAEPPSAATAPEEDSAEFDFFDEQRLSDELDQALEAPLDDKGALPEYEEGAADGGVFDFESEREPYEEDPSQEVLRLADAAEEAEEPPEPPAAPEPPAEEPPRDAAAEEDEYDYDPETGHEDVLEDTPRFLESKPEDDDLWFEQKPPKDFDLD